jgi:hypothetical protein
MDEPLPVAATMAILFVTDTCIEINPHKAASPTLNDNASHH